MKPSDYLLLNNKSWAQERTAADPGFFKRLAALQRPRFLWIGCSDSRVPANTITGTDPGEIFVHRNIANVCVPDDQNMLSVLQYAVDVLLVDHVIVCGHYGCGGVIASMGPALTPPINDWLDNIRNVHKEHASELDTIEDQDDRATRLVELNARAGAHTVARSSIVQAAWKKRSGPWVHAWVYGLKDGALHELESIAPHTLAE
ncbi:MAG TPA: carbonic anhydrase [Polyangiales bacterium]|nr:carbonic anhydrase [Polyangiales bacterium]